jgi:ABC-type glycerol-3-phosphate transport system permease component
MNRAFLIIVVPAALVVIGYFIVFRQSGITLPVGELLVPLVVLLAAAVWWMLRKKEAKR